MCVYSSIYCFGVLVLNISTYIITLFGILGIFTHVVVLIKIISFDCQAITGNWLLEHNVFAVGLDKYFFLM